eukprot:CAMPEP_0196153726 /NCGR_PEP_ID=MMETSP0910-20130528/37710_1 /TAXON_ID=49265 /ORGANISM="Thalassiosira rotula, Strain GSO102" /LENGTH=43 /DNA_ID= /DNA_START= /DNA_END= /DNA_ORIENTATION=
MADNNAAPAGRNTATVDSTTYKTARVTKNLNRAKLAICTATAR